VIVQDQDIKQDIGLVESGKQETKMAFKDIFKDDNGFNEKTIIGFMSFAVMTMYSITDLITGYMGMELPINDFVYNSFLYITLGCFGIAGVEKVMGGKKDAK
jgi:hypothetical protein